MGTKLSQSLGLEQAPWQRTCFFCSRNNNGILSSPICSVPRRWTEAFVSLKAVFCGLVLGTLVTLVGCGGSGSSSSPSPNPTPSLSSITVTPPSAQVSDGVTQQFTATGQYTDGTTKNLTTSVTWSSSTVSVAAINASGVASASQSGTTTITASTGSIRGSATLNVTTAPLISISITPFNPSLAAGTSLQLKAVGVFQDGSTQDLTGSVTWTSSVPSVATVSASGLLRGIKIGTMKVSATKGQIIGVANVTVTAATVVSLSVTPSSFSIAKQTTEQFSAVGTFTDGTTRDITSQLKWTSSQPSIATVSAGLASGLAPGTTTITATSGSVSASASLTVTNANVVSITINPASPTIVVGLFKQLEATGSFSDGSSQNISGVATWASSATAVAATNTAGLVSALSPGTATISAAFESMIGNSNVTVQPPSLIRISVTPSSPTIANTTTQPFAVIGYYNDGSTQTLTNATWSSSDTSVATMNGSTAVSKQPGSTTITAVLNSFSASTTLTVSSATLQSIAVVPANVSMAPGTTKTFFAVGTFSDGSTQNIAGLATWASSNTSVATMQNNLATSVGSGSSTISASFDSVTGSTGLTVTQATLTSLAITPANPVLVQGATQQLTATGTFSDGSTQNLTSLVTWNSSQPTIAGVGSGGLLTGQNAGTSSISATYGSVNTSTTATVSTASLVSISVSPSTDLIPPGFTHSFSAIGTYSDGTTQNLTNSVHWTSSDSTIATVGNSGSSGQVTGISAGWTRISVLLNSIIGSAVVNVNNASLVSIAITPGNPTLNLGTNQQLTATGTFSDGSTQDITPWVSWASSNSQVCVVNSSGFATTSGSGTATITASFTSVSATTTLTVF